MYALISFRLRPWTSLLPEEEGMEKMASTIIPVLLYYLYSFFLPHTRIMGGERGLVENRAPQARPSGRAGSRDEDMSEVCWEGGV